MNKANKGKRGLFASMLKIGCVGFGGGSALIPVIEREVVEEQKLVSKDEYNKDVIVASITPGALPVEIATGLGRRIAGTKGMLLAAFLMAVPGAIVTVLLLTALSGMDASLLNQIEYLAIGVTAFISCLLTDYAVKTWEKAKKGTIKHFILVLLITLGVFGLTVGKNVRNIFGLDGKAVVCLSTLQVLGMAFFVILYTHCKINSRRFLISAVLVALYLAGLADLMPYASIVVIVVKVIMAVLAVYGLYNSIQQSGQQGTFQWKTLLKEETAWVAFLLLLSVPAFVLCGDTLIYLARGLVSSALSFGGGDAYLTVADGLFVDTGMIQQSDFYGHLISIVNALPGSILCKTLTGVGYYVGYDADNNIFTGLMVAMAGFACSVAASGGIFCLIGHVYESFEKLEVFQQISLWIRPIIAGLLLTVMVSMIYQNVQIGERMNMSLGATLGITGAIYLANLLLLYVGKRKNGVLLLVSAVGALVVCNLI